MYEMSKVDKASGLQNNGWYLSIGRRLVHKSNSVQTLESFISGKEQRRG